MHIDVVRVGLALIGLAPSVLVFNTASGATRQILEMCHPLQTMAGPDLINRRQLFRVVQAAGRHIDPAVLSLVSIGELCSAHGAMRSFYFVRRPVLGWLSRCNREIGAAKCRPTDSRRPAGPSAAATMTQRRYGLRAACFIADRSTQTSARQYSRCCFHLLPPARDQSGCLG